MESGSPGLDLSALAAMIDHTLLKPDATAAEVARFCAEARQWNFRSVCVNSDRVREVAAALAGSPVRTCSVVGFPLGAMPPAIKADETRGAVSDGATEIDMVLAIGRLKDGELAAVARDIAAVRAASAGVVLKLIIETCLLSDEEKRTACRLGVAEGVDFVKTSTGFSTGGATTADVALMRATVGPALGVKASGGVRTRAAAFAMIAAGATRIGTSNGLALMDAGAAGEGY